MQMTKAQRQQLILGWCGIVATWVASIGLEVVLLEEWLVLSVIVTTVLAAVVGAQLTRKMTTPHRRASITLRDLRGRSVE